MLMVRSTGRNWPGFPGMKISEKQVRRRLYEKLEGPASRAGLEACKLTDSFDIVHSGLLDSMAFVELVVSLEEEFGIDLDHEVVFEDASFLTVGGLIETFVHAGEEGGAS